MARQTDFDTLCNEDTFDTRDMMERLAEIEDSEDADERAECERIRAAQSEIEQYAGDKCDDGIQMVADSYFKEHAQQLAEDCDMIPRDLAWPYTCIDWDQAARDLRMDYTAITLTDSNGTKHDFWYR